MIILIAIWCPEFANPCHTNDTYIMVTINTQYIVSSLFPVHLLFIHGRIKCQASIKENGALT
jgi:hypothetical protein